MLVTDLGRRLPQDRVSTLRRSHPSTASKCSLEAHGNPRACPVRVTAPVRVSCAIVAELVRGTKSLSGSARWFVTSSDGQPQFRAPRAKDTGSQWTTPSLGRAGLL